MRVGQGYDIHRLVSGRKLVLGGVEIASEKGEEGHSDGDVLLHAIIDALFGAAAIGDIGTHFPPEDADLKDISSRKLLKEAGRKIFETGYSVVNIDATVVLQKPRIREYIHTIKNNIAGDLGIDTEAVSVKGKTAEKMGPVGMEKAIEAYAVCLIQSR